MSSNRGLLLAGSVVALGVAWWWYKSNKSSERERRFVQRDEEVEEDIEAGWVSVEKQAEEKTAPLVSHLPLASPRTVRNVLEEKGEETRAEEEAVEFELISPRLEAFLTASPAVKVAPIPAGKKPSAGARGPKAAASRPPRAKVTMTALDLDASDELDEEEVKKILAKGRKSMAAEEKAAPFPIVSPRLEKFLQDDQK